MGKLTVQLRNGFSDRNGIKKINTEIQYIDFDRRTRISFLQQINYLYNYAKNQTISFNDIANFNLSTDQFAKTILCNLYKVKVDFSENYEFEYIEKRLEETILIDTYDAVLTTVEFVAKLFDELFNLKDVYSLFNQTFEGEFVGYRFVGNLITKITDEHEIESINESLTNSDDDIYKHINKALYHLSNRDRPDYENSIKESITAVETICNKIADKRKATLGDALKVLKQKGAKIHPALNDSFLKLYGYTSDANGIRHSGDLGGPDSTFEEAKFMLVSCCAFINYLKGNIRD